MNKKAFGIGDLLGIGFTLVVLGIGLAYGLQVMGDVRSDMITGEAGCNSTVTSSCGTDYNATSSAIEGVSKIPEKLPTIALIIVAAVIIGILVRYLWVRYAA